MSETKAQALTRKYRPTTWDEVVGHDAQINALMNAIEKNASQCYLFTGGSGLGKTTLARIAAAAVGCKSEDLIQVDAATKTGIAEMREVQEELTYRPVGEGAVKAIIVDEVHALSKPAVQSLLKVTEEPPEWAYWFLCTTEPTRVLPTLRTRCVQIYLKPLPTRTLITLLVLINKKEKMNVHTDIIALCAQEAGGSARQSIENLILCAAAESTDEARELLHSVEAPAEAFQLAQLLARNARWSEVQKLLGSLPEGVNPESVRHVVRAYVTKVILNAKSNDQVGFALEILDAFSTPFHSADGISPLVMACGKVLVR